MALKDIKGRTITVPVYIPTGQGEIDLQSAGGDVDLSEYAKTEDVELITGDKSTLVTTDKTDLVSAINETFTNANNGKQVVRSAVVGKGGTLPADPTFQQIADQIDLTYMFTKDPDLIAGNVKAGVTIGDVAGNLVAGSISKYPSPYSNTMLLSNGYGSSETDGTIAFDPADNLHHYKTWFDTTVNKLFIRKYLSSNNSVVSTVEIAHNRDIPNIPTSGSFIVRVFPNKVILKRDNFLAIYNLSGTRLLQKSTEFYSNNILLENGCEILSTSNTDVLFSNETNTQFNISTSGDYMGYAEAIKINDRDYLIVPVTEVDSKHKAYIIRLNGTPISSATIYNLKDQVFQNSVKIRSIITLINSLKG